MGVKVNDDMSDYFQTKKGFRQGDQLLLLLFNLVADMRAILISRDKEGGISRG